MNLELLSEASLRQETKNCATREKEATALLIEHLIEVEKRSLYLKWGHGSLFNYLTDELSFERGAASLRVSAVRASKSVSNVKEKIESGELSLKNIRTVESFIYHETKERGKEFTKSERKELYSQVSNVSCTKAEERLVNLATSQKFLAPLKEVDRAVKGSKRLIQFTVDESEYELLLKAKEVLSHKYPGATTGELYKLAVKDLVERRHPKYRAERIMAKGAKEVNIHGAVTNNVSANAPVPTKEASVRSVVTSLAIKDVGSQQLSIYDLEGVRFDKTNDITIKKLTVHERDLEHINCTQLTMEQLYLVGKTSEQHTTNKPRYNIPNAATVADNFSHPDGAPCVNGGDRSVIYENIDNTKDSVLKRSRYINAKDEHALWIEYDGKGCMYIDKNTGKRCGCVHKLQRDHKKAFALGGTNTKPNLQIYCQRHNLYKALT